jgi:membrane-bound lytic murein transglycosylase D
MLIMATPSPIPLPSLPNTKEVLAEDVILTEVEELLREAEHHVEQGDDDAAMTFLIRIRDLLMGDGAASTPESRRRREHTLAEVDALLEEIIAIRAIAAATQSDGEAPLVSPEDVAVLEKATPKMAPWEKPEITYDVPIEITPQVQAYIELFTTAKREQIAMALDRSGQYLPMMRQIFAEKGLPQDLVNLAYIESAFKVTAYSRARAVGIWQFIRGTGRKYGLKRNWWLDERRDPVKATSAAAEYLSDLYALFESWPLAIAGYNAGEGKVLKAIRRQKTTDVWKLKLPRETKFYVPAFMAMTIIAKDPEAYGFTPPVERPWEVDQVTLSEPTDLRLLAKAAGVSTEELRDLNPELRRLVTPPGEDYLLNLPGGSEGTFRDALAQLPRVRRVGWQRRQVRRGETLSTIAQRYGTTVPTLMEMNHLKNPHQIRAGTRITVPVPALALAEPSKTKPGANRTDASLYVVQHGDTLWDIARAHEVSTGDLKRWNDLHGSLIHPGNALRISPDRPEVDGVARSHHRIRRGETLSTIAQRYGTTVPTLMEMNQLNTPHQIRAGTRITVPVPDESLERYAP